MEWIINEENDWDHNVERGAVEGPVVCVSREDLLQALNEMKTAKVPGPSDVSLELIVASGGVGIHVMSEICQRVLDGFGMPVEWALSIVVLIFKGKGDIRNSSCYRAAKLLVHGLEVMKRVIGKRLYRIVTVDDIQFGFMSERGAIDVVFILRRMQEVYQAKVRKLYMCFVDLCKGFDRVPRKMLE